MTPRAVDAHRQNPPVPHGGHRLEPAVRRQMKAMPRFRRMTISERVWNPKSDRCEPAGSGKHERLQTKRLLPKSVHRVPAGPWPLQRRLGNRLRRQKTRIQALSAVTESGDAQQAPGGCVVMKTQDRRNPVPTASRQTGRQTALNGRSLMSKRRRE